MDSDFYECPECKTKVKNIHRETHDLYCRNTIKASEYANLIPCEICGNLINFDDFMTHMETCGRAIPPPPSSLINLLSSFPPLNTSRTTESSEHEDTEHEDTEEVPSLNSNNESLNNTLPSLQPLPLPPLTSENIHEQINELLRNITEIDNMIDRNNIDQNTSRMPFPMMFRINNPNINEPNNSDDDYQHFTNLINQMGNVSVGIDDINKVTTIEVNKIDCPICGDEHEIIRRTSCGHDFCFNCLNEWIRENKTCPVCSLELKEL